MGLSGEMERNTPCCRRREGWGEKTGLMLVKPLVLIPEPRAVTKGRDPGGQERPARSQILHGDHTSAGARQGSGMGSAIIPILLPQPTAWMQPSPSRSPVARIHSSCQAQHPTVTLTGSKALCGGCHVQAISTWMVGSPPVKGSCRVSALQCRDIEVHQASHGWEPLPLDAGTHRSAHAEKV